jgi:hypothetical protein
MRADIGVAYDTGTLGDGLALLMYGRLGEVDAEVKVKQRTSILPCTVSRNLNPNLRLSLRLEARREVTVQEVYTI